MVTCGKIAASVAQSAAREVYCASVNCNHTYA